MPTLVLVSQFARFTPKMHVFCSTNKWVQPLQMGSTIVNHGVFAMNALLFSVACHNTSYNSKPRFCRFPNENDEYT